MDLGTALSSTGALKVKNSVVATDYYPFRGGLDLMDPPMSIPAGSVIGCQNFEPAIRGGYRRSDGYERFDGHPSPSDATFITLALNTVAGIAAGQTATQGAVTGTVAYVDATNLAAVLVSVSGTFVVGSVTIGANPFTVTAVYANAGATTALTATYQLQKFLYLQQAISALPYTKVLGVFPYLSTVYAIASDGTQGHLYKATTTGWQEVPLGIKIQFTAGVYSSSMEPPAEGTVCTGSTSGATFTINRINAMTGTWGTDAAGWIVTSSITGTPVAGETFKNGTTTLFTYQSNAAQTLPASGNYEFRVFNFNAAQNPDTGYRLYAVNGVGQGFEFEGTQSVFCNIDTGMSPDTPTHLEVHASYLFFSFPGGSLQNSGYQYPLNWNPVFGASARSVGEDVTFLKEDISETLIIGTRKRVWTLTGISTELFQIQVYAANTGAIQWSVEQPGQIIFMEDRGFTTVSASQEYGDFEANSLSDAILTLATSLAANDTPVGAIVTRKKNLYRIAFASGAVLALGMNAKGQFTGWTECGYPIAPVLYVCGYTQGSTGPQQERAFMADDTGTVYEIDKGWTFDGSAVNAFMKLAYYSSKSPDIYKRYRRLRVDLQPEGWLALTLAVDFDYGNRTAQNNFPLQFTTPGGIWDVALWDTFLWDAPQYTQAVMKVEGEGYNIGLFFSSSAATDFPYTLYGASLQWSRRILNRNTGND